MASSRRFEDLKDELIAQKEQIRIHLRKNANETTITKLFSDGDALLESIRAEVDKCPASVQSEMNSRFFAVKNEWQAFRKTARRPQLMGNTPPGYGTDVYVTPTTTSAILNEGISALQNTAASLRRSEIVARESEEIGTNVIDELGTQRESLIRTRGRIDDSNANLKRSHRIVRLLNAHALTNKALLVIIIFIEIIILAAIVYFRFIMKHKAAK